VRLAKRLTLAVAMVGILGGCGGHGSGVARPPANRDVTLSVGTSPGLGRFLVSAGWTLYMYPPDRQRAVTCTKVEQCEQAWPPLFVAAGHTVLAGPGVQRNLIGSMPGDGGRVVTYDHWPLYYYIGDRQADVVHGQDQGFNWFVMAPSGAPIKTDLASPTG
jgi:predicted lipoprotein with Yx(FWY)xxD motif